MLCVIAKIDEAARERLSRLQRTAGQFGIPTGSLYGHVTLATYVGADEAGFVASCRAALSEAAAFSFRYEAINVLEASAIIVASPEKTGELAAIQRLVAGGWDSQLDVWTRESVWTPHTTLAHGPDADLSGVLRAMREQFHPFPAKVERIEFSKVMEKSYEIVDSVPLRPCGSPETRTT